MNKGYTLIEIIIVICIFILLMAIFWPMGTNFYRQQVLNKAQQQAIWILKQARADAINQKNNSAFGVYFTDGQGILFQGNSFNQRLDGADIVYTMPAIVNLSGSEEFIFAPNTGFVSNPGSINFKLGLFAGEIKVNELGVIDY